MAMHRMKLNSIRGLPVLDKKCAPRVCPRIVAPQLRQIPSPE
jgi:hypothetical protein